MPAKSSIVITFKVRVRENHSCFAPISNSGIVNYTTPNGSQDSRSYQGDLVGLEQDDIKITGCSEIQANRDYIKLTNNLVGSIYILQPKTYSSIGNDIILSPNSGSIDPNSVNISPVNLSKLDIRLLYEGSSTGVSSLGESDMT